MDRMTIVNGFNDEWLNITNDDSLRIMLKKMVEYGNRWPTRGKQIHQKPSFSTLKVSAGIF